MVWPAVLGVLAVILLVVRVVAVFRFADARGNATTAVAFAPPRQLTPLLAAALLPSSGSGVGRTSSGVGRTSSGVGRPGSGKRYGVPGELLDLAVRGVWKLGVADPDAPARQRIWFVARPSLERPALPEETSRLVYDAVFDPGDVSLRRDLTRDAERTAALAEAVHAADEAVVQRGWLERWTPTRADRLLTLGAAAVAVASFFGLFTSDAGVPDNLWFLVPGAVALAAAWLRPRARRLTPEGRRLTDELDGLRLYMTMAEADRLRVLQSPDTAERLPVAGGAGEVARLNERLLGYAVVFGILPAWSEVVAASYEDADLAPLWLVLPGYDLASALTWAAVLDAGGVGFLGDFGGGDFGGF